MPRLLFSDEHWSKLREILLHKAIYNKREPRIGLPGNYEILSSPHKLHLPSPALNRYPLLITKTYGLLRFRFHYGRDPTVFKYRIIGHS